MGNLFFGYYEHSLDDKGRLVIPRKLREGFGERLYIMRGFDGALAIYREDRFQKMLDEAEAMPFTKSNNRAYLRNLLASACELEFDKMGRVQLPSQLLNKYHIGKDVAIIGAGNHIEVWDKLVYETYEKQANENFEKLAESLNKED